MDPEEYWNPEVPQLETTERTPMSQTYNHDVKAMAQRIDRICVEINRAASGNVAGVTEFDMTRWSSYLDALEGYTRWITDQPSPLDLPETHPTLLQVDDPEQYDPVDNLIANDLVRLLVLGRMELISSQSSSHSSGLIVYDVNRWIAILQKCRALLELAEAQTPLDLPESLPHYPGVKPGNRGVHTPADSIDTP